jgi:nitrate reductase assembly molybdenum cofactor insertion protein NarJ
MTETAAIADARVRDLLAEATEWRLLGVLLERPREGWWQEVAALSGEVRDPDTSAAAASAREEAAEGLYLAILGPGGVVSPREVAYRPMGDPGHVLADIQAFYQAFAFRPETEEPPDHIAVEAGFIGYLCLKEAFARSRGQGDEGEIVFQAAARFREEHLSVLAWPLAQRLESADVGYLSLAARALARRSGPRPTTNPIAESLLPSCGSSCPLDCGQP